MDEEELLRAPKAAREAGVASGLNAAVRAKERLRARDEEKRYVNSTYDILLMSMSIQKPNDPLPPLPSSFGFCVG